MKKDVKFDEESVMRQLKGNLTSQNEDIVKSSQTILEGKHIEIETKLSKMHNTIINLVQKVADIEVVKSDVKTENCFSC